MFLVRRITLLATLAVLLLGGFSVHAEQYRWSGVDRVVALSDPHGAYDAFGKTLRNAGVVDANGDWTGGETHLVVTGDLLDRGADSRKIMDLIMKLERQAPAAGGMVHLTLGNHEVMNLVGDLRYVSPGEFAAFAAEESPEERERWFQKLLSSRRVKTDGDVEVDEDALKAEFDRTRPPGFYGHRAAFGSEGKYGRWLMQKPLMVVINDTAYVHGGMPVMVGKLGLERLNEELLGQVTGYVSAMELLNREGLMDPAVNFYDQGTIAERIRNDTSLAPEQLTALDSVVELNHASVHDSGSPLWYRGTVGCSLPMEGDIVTQALDAVSADRVVIGHTPTVTRQVLSRFGGRVIEIDTGMLSAAYHGSGHALIIEDGEMTIVDEHGVRESRPVPHPRRVGYRSDALSAEVIENLLSRGTIVEATTDEAGQTIVEVEWDGSTVSARFVKSPRKKDLNTELAAYRLDKLLALDMVPVTVAREVDGDEGTLQFLPKNSRDEAYRSAGGQGGGAWCPIQRQWNSMYIFDALVYNEGRIPTSMVYSPENWQLLLMGHENAFGTHRGKPRYLEQVPLELSDAWVAALRGLTDERLAEQLGDVLDRRRLSALAKRRDELLDEAD
jgi:hypothetical protein